VNVSYNKNTSDDYKIMTMMMMMMMQGFFQRSLTRKSPYKCVADERMEWSQAIKTCSHCRYNRCLQAGMSRDGLTLTLSTTVI